MSHGKCELGKYELLYRCSLVNLKVVNLLFDNGVKDFFMDSEYEVTYGDIVLRLTLFQDDISTI